jgi:hypothetical protein
VTLTNIDAHRSYRNGLSVIDVVGLTVSDSAFRLTNGTAPQSGIDLEPDNHFERLTDITFTNVWVTNNSGSGFEIELGNFVGSEAPLTVTVTGMRSMDNVGSGLFIRADAMLRGRIVITNAVINGTGGAGGVVGSGSSCGVFLSNILAVAGPRHGGPDPNGESGAELSLDNVSISRVSGSAGAFPICLERSWVPAHGCLMTPTAAFVGHPERRQYCGEGGAFGGLGLGRIAIADTHPRPFLNASLGCTWAPSERSSPGWCGIAMLANITGSLTVSNPSSCAYNLGDATTVGWDVSVRCEGSNATPQRLFGSQ